LFTWKQAGEAHFRKIWTQDVYKWMLFCTMPVTNSTQYLSYYVYGKDIWTIVS